MNSLYQSILGQTADASNVWATALAKGASPSRVAQAIYTSPEATSLRAQHKVPRISEAAAYRKALVAQRHAG